jgi:hypothetical protein
MVAMGVVISDEQLALALPHIREGMGMAEFQGEVEGKIRGICTTIQSGEDIKGSLVELQSFFASKDEEKKAVEEKRDVSNLDTIMGANGFYGKVLNIIGGYPCDDGKQESFKSLLKALNSQNKHRPMVGFTENGHANSVVGELAQAYYANVKKAGFLKKSVEDSKEEGRNLFVQQENPAPAPDGALTLPEILAIGPVALAVSNFLSHRSNANLILTGGAIDYAEKAMMVAQTNRKDCNRNAELVAKITGIPAEEQTLFNPQGKIISSIQGLNRSLDDCRTSLGGNHMQDMIVARRDANSVSQGRSA